MVPTQSFVDLMVDALMASPVFGTGSDTYDFYLIAAPFTPGLNLVSSDLTYATFTGGAGKVGGTPPQLQIRKSDTGQWGVLAIEPTGGAKWVCTAAPASPETIYGWALRKDGTTLVFTQLLPEPVTIAQVGDFVEVTAIMGFFTTMPLGNN